MVKRAKYAAMAGLLIVPAAAFTFGGWATITIEDLPEYAVAGEPMKLPYTVRQHGHQLLGRLYGSVTATASKGEARATPAATTLGAYDATVTLPEPGQWSIQVHSGFLESKITLLPITVIAKAAPAPAAMSAGNRGRHLFVAKGCVTCHSHQLTKGYNSNKAGPDLSEPKFVSAYLARFLADPSIKTTWANMNRMPDLGLKPAEIAALVSFLNRETVASR